MRWAPRRARGTADDPVAEALQLDGRADPAAPGGPADPGAAVEHPPPYGPAPAGPAPAGPEEPEPEPEPEPDDPSLIIADADPDTLIDERRTAEHPEQYGRPGRPLTRSSPFYIGFLGALGVLLAYVLVQAVAHARSVLVLIVVSMFLAVGLNPAVEALMRRGLRRPYAVTVVFIAVIAAFVGFGFAVVPPLVEQSTEFTRNAPALLQELLRSRTIRNLDDQYGIIEKAQDYVSSGDLGTRAFGGILGLGRIVVGAVFSAFSVLILTLYFLAGLPSIKRQAYLLAPASRRQRVSLLGDEILTSIGSFVSGILSVALLAGLSSFVFLTVVGAPYALPLALLVAITDLIPMVGATIGAVVVTLVAFTDSVAVGVSCIVFYVVYQQVENYLVYPRVMRRSVDVPAPVTVMAALLGATLLGVVGALLAIPLAAAALLLVREVLIPRQDRN